MFKYTSNARENQDLFVLAILNKKRNGTYVEVGANTPIKDSATYLLESEFDWTGISLEWNRSYAEQHSFRKNVCLCTDATKVDYTALFEKYNLGPHIDFLQLDIEPHPQTFAVLNKIDFTKYSFSFITYEHDFYQGGVQERLKSREILKSHGYTRVIGDVSHGGLVFEDWYINEKYMPNEVWKKFIGDNINMNTDNLSEATINLFNEYL